MPRNVIGVDIAKHWIDTYSLESGKACRIETTSKSLKAFAAGCRDALVVFEAGLFGGEHSRLERAQSYADPRLMEYSRRY